MKKTLYHCIAFAKFAALHKVRPFDLAMLILLANQAFAAGEREANTNKSASPARQRFEEHAKSLGFGVMWPGLWPLLSKDGRDVELPAI